jgi:protein tyrosine phosphatase
MTYYLTYIFLKGSEFTFTIDDIIKFALTNPMEHDIHYHSLAYLQAYFNVYPKACIVDTETYDLKIQVLSTEHTDANYIYKKKQIKDKKLPGNVFINNEEPKFKVEDDIVFDSYCNIIKGRGHLNNTTALTGKGVSKTKNPSSVSVVRRSQPVLELPKTSKTANLLPILPSKDTSGSTNIQDIWEEYRNKPVHDLKIREVVTFPCDIYQYGVQIYQKNRNKSILKINEDVLSLWSFDNKSTIYLHKRHVLFKNVALYKCFATFNAENSFRHGEVMKSDLLQINKIHDKIATGFRLYDGLLFSKNVDQLDLQTYDEKTNGLEKEIFLNNYNYLTKSGEFESEFDKILNPNFENELFIENKNKNRYQRDIRLNIDTRVELDVDNNNGSKTKQQLLDESYIHANYVLPNTEQLCIVTQGPKDNTIVDFWNMVIQEECNLIVMLTDFEESTKEGVKDKCAVYFPLYENKTEKITDQIEVKCTYISKSKHWTMRKLHVTRQDKTHKLWHFHTTKWSDHNIAKDYSLFTEYFENIKSLTPPIGQLKPVIHCSAGIGRSGTFVAIIALLKWKDIPHHEINIKGLVALLRKQRYRMVQNKDQYKMIYDVLDKFIDMKF